MAVHVIQKRTRKFWVLLGIILTACLRALAAKAASQVNPYSAIFQRNVFDLRAPIIFKEVPPTPPVLPKITLTGITTILGKKIAFLTIPGLRPGTRSESMALTEGQAENDVEVKQIDDRTGLVKIINHGEPQTLDFERDGAKRIGRSVFRN